MSLIEQMFRQSQLAQLVYSNALSVGISDSDLRAAAKDVGLIADDDPFFARLTVLSISGPTTSDFSAALFKDTQTGQLYLATRGTDSFVDALFADVLGIGVMGTAAAQVVDLYRYFRCLTTPAGQAVQYSFAEDALLNGVLSSFGVTEELVSDNWSDVGTGALLTPDGSIAQFTVGGHSLGGHLAQWAAALFDPHVSAAYTFNGAGVGSGFFDTLLSAIVGVAPTTSPTLDPAKLTHVFAEPGIEFTAGTHQYPGQPLPVFIEDSGQLDNHRVGLLVDALEVVRTLCAIDPRLTTHGASGILYAVSSEAADSLESMMNAVGRILRPGWMDIGIGDREALYAATSLLREEVAPQPGPVQTGYTILGLTGLGPDSIAAAAAGGAFASDAIAWRYALQQLNPFVLVAAGPDGTVDVSATNNLYAPFAPTLQLYDARTGEGEITDRWLSDRAEALLARNQAFTDDRDVLVSPDGVVRRYETHGASGFESVQMLPAALIAAREFIDLSLFEQHDLRFGSASGEELQGSAGESHLYGGGGNDLLAGGRGADYLEGGAGFDTYRSAAGEGADTILDTDGLGRVQFTRTDGATDLLTGGTFVSDGVWRSTDGRYRYEFENHPESEAGTLVVSSGADRLTLLHFRPGQLGIQLPGAPADARQRELVEGTAGDDRGADAIYGSSVSEEIRGFDGDDDINGNGGADLFHGGSGSDLLVASERGEPQPVRMYGEDGDDIAVLAGASSSELDGGAGRDFLSADSGDDVLLGGAGDDALFGAGGADVLRGGAGADVLGGDATYTTFDRAWQHVFEDRGFYRDYRPSTGAGAGSTFSPNDGNDLIHGGSGNDYLFGGGGDDTLIGGDALLTAGEPDDDELIGDAGSDRLSGGDGNDRLFGDRPEEGGSTGSDVLEAGRGQDLLIGGGGADELSGDEGDDELFGDYAASSSVGGDDRLDGGEGNDRLQAGAGNDRLVGGAGADLLFGDAGADSLDGGTGDDQLAGGEGDDLLTGADGDDALFGEAGADVLDGGAGADQLAGGEGDDGLSGGEGDDLLFGEGGNDRLHGDGGRDRAQGGDGDDEIHGGLEADALSGGAGGDALHGDEGDDELQGGADDDVLDGGEGADRLYGDSGHDRLAGGKGHDLLVGDDGDDVLHGGAGADELQGSSGADTLAGGSGDDALFGGDGIDTYVYDLGDGADRIRDDGLESGDQLVLGGIASTDLILARQGSILALLVSGGAEPDGTQSLSLRDWFGPTGSGIDRIVLADASWSRADLDSMTLQASAGTLGDDVVSDPGSEGVDTLYGFAGNDVLYSGSGSNVLIGGAGNDHLVAGPGSTRIRVGEGDGEDTIFNAGIGATTLALDPGTHLASTALDRRDDDLVVRTSTTETTVKDFYAGHRLSLEFSDGSSLDPETLSRTGMASSSAHRHVRGTDLVLQDWGGEDSLAFDLGVAPGDVQIRRDGIDLVASAGASGQVTVAGWFDGYSRQIEELRFADGTRVSTRPLTDSLLNPVGGPGNDSLMSGAEFREVMEGGAGDDRLESRGAGDLLRGGVGSDVLVGDAAGQTYVFDRGDGQDEIADAGGSDAIVWGYGRGETRFTQGTRDLTVEALGTADRIVIRDAAGTGAIEGFTFTETGTEGDDVIRGAAFGPEIIRGLGGNDQLYGGDDDVFDAYYQMSDQLEGGEGNDLLDGGWGTDRLFGGAGDDILGGAVDSADFLGTGNVYEGGAGNDTLRGTRGNDVYRYAPGDGYDQIIDPVRPGDTSGLLDRDMLRFGPGLNPDDVAVRRSGTDLLLECPDGGQVLVRGWYTDAHAQIETVEFESSPGVRWTRQDLTQAAAAIRGSAGADLLQGTSGADALYGMGGNDVLLAGDGDDLLDGGTGDDRLVGGGGSDTYRFNTGGGRDTVEETAAGGIDRLQFGAGITASAVAVSRAGDSLVLSTGSDSVTLVEAIADANARIETVEFTDGSALPSLDELVEQLVSLRGGAGDDLIEGTAHIDRLYGVDGADRLAGYGGADLLDGGHGADTLDGGAGADLLRGGDGEDRYLFSAGSGSDRVEDSEGTSTLHFAAAQTSLALDIFWTGAAHELRVSSGAGDEVRMVQGLALNPRIEADSAAVTTAQDLIAVRQAAGVLLEHSGSSAADVIAGTRFRDRIDGAMGNDSLLGFGGADVLYGGFGSDVLSGGAGDDLLQGGPGRDVFLFGFGDGKDTLVEHFGDSASGDSLIRLTPGTGMADVRIAKSGKNLLVSSETSGDALTVQGYVSGKSTLAIGVEGADGLSLSANALASQAVKVGSSGADTLRGGTGSERMYGDRGNDALLGKGGDDWMYGGLGNDTLDGGAGSDTYLFASGHGQDVVREGSGAAGEIDTLQFGSGISLMDLQYRRVSSDLVIADASGANAVTITGWYSGASGPIERIREVSGYEILNSQVEQLVQATSAFGSPAAAGMLRPSLPADPYEPLLTVSPTA